MSKIQFFCESQHNKISVYHLSVVYQYVKDTIFLRITTQLQVAKRKMCCLSVCQRYNFFANHNTTTLTIKCLRVVYQYVKDTIFLRITTSYHKRYPSVTLFISMSKIQFFCESQLVVPDANNRQGCLSVCQRYNFFANHNVFA